MRAIPAIHAYIEVYIYIYRKEDLWLVTCLALADVFSSDAAGSEAAAASGAGGGRWGWGGEGRGGSSVPVHIQLTQL